LNDKLALSKAVIEEQQAHFAGISHCTLKGLPTSIDPNSPPMNFKDRSDRQIWAEAYDKEYRGIYSQGARSKTVGSNHSRTWLPVIEDRYTASITLLRNGRRPKGMHSTTRR
jgi:hypothetical protein